MLRNTSFTLGFILCFLALVLPIKISAKELNIWWPTPNVTLSRIQPFKGLLSDVPVDQYEMFWQVDDGQWNPMATNFADYPHKEASVDLSGWTWKNKGPYLVRFIARQNGQTIMQRDVSIMIDGSEKVASSASSFGTGSEPSPVPIPMSSQPSTPPTVAHSSSLNSASSEPAMSSANSSSSLLRKEINVLWPGKDMQLKNRAIFQARIDDLPLTQYTMYWSVDHGQFNFMQDNFDGIARKSADIDLTHWTWNGSGPYHVTFTVRMGNTTLEKTITVFVRQQEPGTSMPGSPVSSFAASTSSPATNLPISAPEIGTSSPATGWQTSSQSTAPALNQNSSDKNPFAGQNLYINLNGDAKKQADQWRKDRPYDASLLDMYAAQPETFWFGNWNSDLPRDVKNALQSVKAQGALPVFVAYNIPARDCGGYSAGGSGSPGAYRAWIRTLANAIGSEKAVVLLEPDALASQDCLSQADREIRLDLLRDAVQVLKAKDGISVYIDAGHARWKSSDEMAARLKSAGIEKADGFALNISNFQTNQDSASYGETISKQVGNKHFIVDTGRNGRGHQPGDEWCNPWNAALGTKPTTSTGFPLIDAFLWVKGPGGSDGQCNGAPSAGTWWADYALRLIKNAGW